ncbi:MAG: N-acetyltransferase [Planctomycetes bacterium]|nr:N-acetyltransferase [Planctomycetota bacterium]
MSEPSAPRIHPTALVEHDVQIGAGTAVWDGVHIRGGARIGRDCIVGEKTYVAGDVRIGDRCKLNACVYVCAGIELEDGVLVAAHTVFTNDPTPRATDPEVRALLASEAPAAMPRTLVRRGASIGANCTIGPGLELGAFCLVGMGSTVTRPVPPHALVLGNPARLVGAVCRCGRRVATAVRGTVPIGDHRCRCGRTVRWSGAAGGGDG